MTANTRWFVTVSSLTFLAGFCLGNLFQPSSVVQAQASGRVFELRTYTTYEGKLDDLLARFRNHTTKLFEKHGMTNVGYWVPADAPQSQNTLIYVLAHPSREAATKNWASFQADPEWVKVRTDSEAQGKINEKVVSVFMNPTDYSTLK